MHDVVAIKEQIRTRVDLVELVSEHTALKRQGRNFIGLCPFHQEKTPSFSVNPERQFFKCFGCNVGGDVFTFVQLRESVEFPEALRILADRAGIELSAKSDGARTAGSSRADMARANAWACDRFCSNLQNENLGRSARAYLDSRGIEPDTIAAFRIGLATGDGNPLLRAATAAGFKAELLLDAGLCRANERGSHYDTFRERLMFPIRDTMGRCTGFGGRTLIDDKAKYMNTSQTGLFDKSKSLFGIDLAREAIEREGSAILVEGYTDCVAAHQHGFSNAVAALGTAATETHMAQLRRYCQQVILLFDSDAAGEAAADRAVAVALKQNLAVKLANVPEGKDPCEYLQHTGPQGFRNLLNSAVDALVFKWNRTRSRYRQADSAASRRDAVSEFVTLVGDLSGFGVLDAIQKGIIIEQVSSLLSVPPEQVRSLFTSRTRAGRSAGPPGSGSETDGRPRGVEQTALVTMLEVLVNEPGLYDTVADQFDPQRFAKPGQQRIAAHVRDLVETYGEFQFGELQACVEDAADAELLTDLAIRGAGVGNYAATLDGAAQRLSAVDAARETERLTEELRRGEANGCALDPSGVRDRLTEIGQRLAGQSHFAHRRAMNDCGVPRVVASQDPEGAGRQE